MSKCPYRDPFKKARTQGPSLATEFDGDPVAMLLGFHDVRDAARDTKTYSSDAPFRVPIPREEDVRTVRQYPLEVDPPEHGDYRKIVEPFFRRASQPDYIQKMENLAFELVSKASASDSIEIVREFAIPFQSRALTYLLNMPETEAEVWIAWGTHVFRDESGVSKGHEMEAYTNELFDRAEANPGDDFFSALVQAEFRGRKLTREEMQGYANIAFAGGRDTVINTISTIIAYLASNPEDLAKLRANPKQIKLATEEFFRFASPITHIGRMCPVDTNVHGETVKAGDLISLNWASANFDETVFDDPEAIQLDRKPNPHIAFGSGAHLCLGAAHARLIVRSLLKALCERTSTLSLISDKPKYEKEAHYERHNAYHELHVKMEPR
ncbi:MAG: cytochrome [Opitutales bacterium TMED158]|nr:MAG: cytochrome [Opitutales bacterium TMED158]